MKNKIATILFILLTTFSLVPSMSYAALDYSGLVKCDGVTTDSEQSRQTKCNFEALMKMANSIINWLFTLSVPIIIGLIAYAGFLFMTGKSGDREKAKKILWNAIIGFVVMLCAWFIVSTLLKWLVSESFTGANTLIEKQK